MSEPVRPARTFTPAELGFGVLFARAREAVVVANAESGRIILWSPGAVRMFGHPADEVIGRSLEVLVPPELRDAHRAGLARYAASGTGRLIDRDLPVELPALRQDGSRLVVEISLSALEPVPGLARPVLAVIRDVTERSRAEELRVALAREQAAHAFTEQRAAESQEQAVAHAQLSAAMRELNEQSVERQRELEQRVRHADLGAAVGRALTDRAPLDLQLQRCAEAIFDHLDAAFARVWVLEPADDVLRLRASAGLYTHLDGPHSRVPVGALKIGLIASERRPHLTNAVVGDDRVADQEWARREGMVAFAGYPLLVEGDLVGVMALFSKRALPESTLEALETVANVVALAIDRARRLGAGNPV